MIKNVVFCITTYNRIEYLQDCINTFLCTKSDKFNWTIIVADDGSTDGTVEFLENLDLNIPLIIIKNNWDFDARQTNSIFEVCQYLNYDFGFKVDDDIYFLENGWDLGYIDAYERYGFAHLVHYNTERMSYKKKVSYGGLVAPCNALFCMGCMYTFIPEMFKTVGYFDEDLFDTIGHEHKEWTIRCCRAGYNDKDNVYDIKDSYSKIKLKCAETQYHYITYKSNVNVKNWKRLLDVWNNPNIIYKDHKEKPKHITAINCNHINPEISIINIVNHKNRLVEKNITVILRNEILVKTFYNTLKTIGYDNVYINVYLSDLIIPYDNINGEILEVGIDFDGLSHYEKIENMLIILYDLNLGKEISADQLELLNNFITAR